MTHLSKNTTKSLLLYFVVYSDGFHCCAKSTLYYYFPVSQIFYNLFLYGLIDWIFESFPIRKKGVRWERVRMQRRGGRSKHMRAYDGGGGSNFCYFGACVLIEYSTLLLTMSGVA